MNYTELKTKTIPSTHQVCVWYRDTWCGRFKKGVLPSRELIADLIVSSGFYICEVNAALDSDTHIRFSITALNINPLKPKTIVYFDMDGVIADFNLAYHDTNILRSKEERFPVMMEFSKLPSKQKDVIKEELFTYSFFRKMKPIQKGLDLLEYYRKKYDHVVILSAIGNTSKVIEIEQAKRDWLEEHVGNIESHFVNKTENKFEITKLYPEYQNHILIDDREKSIDPWIDNGGIGILYIG